MPVGDDLIYRHLGLGVKLLPQVLLALDAGERILVRRLVLLSDLGELGNVVCRLLAHRGDGPRLCVGALLYGVAVLGKLRLAVVEGGLLRGQVIKGGLQPCGAVFGFPHLRADERGVCRSLHGHAGSAAHALGLVILRPSELLQDFGSLLLDLGERLLVFCVLLVAGGCLDKVPDGLCA